MSKAVPMRDSIQELRGAWRALERRRAVSGLAVLLIALAIGMNTALFSFVDAFVFRKLAVPDPDRLVFIHGGYGGVPYSIMERLKERRELFDAVSGWSDLPAPIEVAGQTNVSLVVRVDRDIQHVLQVRPRIGRALRADDLGTVAVVSHRFWKDRLGSDPKALGRVLRAGQSLVSVVGVMPEEFSGMDTYVPWDVTIP